MSRMIGDITPEQIDDWFKIGKKNVKIHSVPKSTTGGRLLDPVTQLPHVAQPEHVAHYKRRPDFHGGNTYAAEYQRAEEDHLINHSAWSANDSVSVVSSHLDNLELDSTLAGSHVNPHDLVPENATDVYNQYNFSHDYDAKLPISHFKEQIIATVESNQVTVIQGATGSGKTTQVAQYILDHYAKLHTYCNIIVTQPRRIAAISIARRVCQERGWQLGTICGYQVGLDRVANDDTRILYCTTGILLNKLINEKNMHAYTHVILDEVHERDQNTDFSLLVVRKLLRTNSRHTRVVLMSATFDSDMFARYFALPVRDQLEQAPVVNVEGKPFKVLEFYAEDITQLGEIPPLDEGSPEISLEAKSLAVRLIHHFDVLEEKEQGKGPTGFAPMRGTVLVFLPGLNEISGVEEQLRKLDMEHKLLLKIIPLHSSITMEEQAQVFCLPETGWRKVILSTNIAESSITVPDIKYVIDFCLTKNLVCDFETNYTSLQVHWASKANCIQRKGRAGRVSSGRVYRLLTRDFFEQFIPDYGVPEMQRCPLDKLILQVKVLDLGEPKAILALALAPPNLDDIERNVLLLKEVGALSTQAAGYGNKHDGELTFVGRVLADLPVDTKVGKLLVLGHVFGLLEECLIIGAAMSLKSMFARPFKLRLESYRGKLGWAYGSNSDPLAILNAYKTWMSKRDSGAFRRTGAGESGWGKQYYLQIRRLKEISELVKELEKRLVKFNIQKPQHTPHYKTEDQEKLLLKVVLCGAFYPNYFIRGEIDEMESLKSLSGRDPLNTVMVKGLPANQGTLYKQALEDHFRTRCFESNPKAYFEETRAYVEFPWKPNNRSKVHDGVYMACKMRQLRLPVVIDLFSSDEAHTMLQRLQAAQDRAVGPTQLRTNRLTTGQVTEEAGSSRVASQVVPPDATRTMFTICVTAVLECGHFWAQYGEEENYQQLYMVHEALNRERGRNLSPIKCHVRPGIFCVAPFMDETLEYYRAKVQLIDRKFDEGLRAYRDYVEVVYVDYGNTGSVAKDELRELTDDLLQVPFQAFECRLIQVRPSPIRCPDGKWTEEATTCFKKMIMNTKTFANPYSIVHRVLRVELIIQVPAAPHLRQVDVRQQLIELGFADDTEESNLSKQNHEQRVVEYNQSRHKPIVTEENQRLGATRQADWLQVSLGMAGAESVSRRRGARVTLTGPHNPYEMNFYSITNVGRLRAAKIDPDSVNSVAIDDEPHNPTQRLMVAGFVGLNPSGSSMIARDTTIMPLLPGLPAIILLLFAPVAEFRVDPKKTRYIGAICGLGTNPHTGYPALPDDDIEIPFDVKIDVEDIYKINGVRMAINIAIGSHSSVTGWGPDAILKVQASARKKLLDLIQKRREPCEIQNPVKMYAWDQVCEDDVMPHGVENQDCPMLLNLHTGISLAETDNPADAETEKMRSHVRHLRDIVRSNRKQGSTMCELCHVKCPTTKLLALHLETANHKKLASQNGVI